MPDDPCSAQSLELTLRVAHRVRRCRTLGPGTRGVLWVAGCQRRCPGCIAGPILDSQAGTLIPLDQLVTEILSWGDIEGLTFSGGEPFEQATALAELCRRLRAVRDLTFLAYSGFTLEELRGSADEGRRQLLAQLDLLVDGPFIRSQQASLLWRGSANQKIHFLTGRYRDLVPITSAPGAGVELHVSHQGQVFWAGVPEPGFHEQLVVGLAERGIHLHATDGIWT